MNDSAPDARLRYWSFASPGIILIRRLLLRPLKGEAERRARRVRLRQDDELATAVADPA